jgi:Na+/proline symporter
VSDPTNQGNAAYGQVPPPYYQPPYYQMPAAPHKTTNGLAIASMVLGIVWIYWVGSILALVFGYVALGQIRQRNQNGGGMAIAGIVLGWVGVGILLLIIFVGVLSSL